MVRIQKTSEHVRVTRTYDVTGAEPMQHEYRTTPLQPDSIVVAFGDGKFVKASITGANIRKNGSLGEHRHTNNYYRGDVAEMPEWAVPLTRFEEEDLPESLATRMENDASSYDNDPEPWGED